MLSIKSMMFKCISASVYILIIVSAYTQRAIQDQITNLPGTENLNITFNQFSGYLQSKSFT